MISVWLILAFLCIAANSKSNFEVSYAAKFPPKKRQLSETVDNSWMIKGDNEDVDTDFLSTPLFPSIGSDFVSPTTYNLSSPTTTEDGGIARSEESTVDQEEEEANSTTNSYASTPEGDRHLGSTSSSARKDDKASSTVGSSISGGGENLTTGGSPFPKPRRTSMVHVAIMIILFVAVFCFTVIYLYKIWRAENGPGEGRSSFYHDATNNNNNLPHSFKYV